jgi:hypothetical protein
MEEKLASADAAGRTTSSERGSLSRFLADHPGVCISALYLVSSAVGMLDSWWYYRQFHINIFFHSDLADFLLASFRSPTAWLVVGLTASLAAFDQFSSRRWGRKGSAPRWLRWLGSKRYRQSSAALAILMAIAYIVYYASMRADSIHDGHAGQQVEVRFADSDPGPKTAVLLGSTLNFVFLLDRADGTVTVHPYENVVAIVLNAAAQ